MILSYLSTTTLRQVPTLVLGRCYRLTAVDCRYQTLDRLYLWQTRAIGDESKIGTVLKSLRIGLNQMQELIFKSQLVQVPYNMRSRQQYSLQVSSCDRKFPFELAPFAFGTWLIWIFKLINGFNGMVDPLKIVYWRRQLLENATIYI